MKIYLVNKLVDLQILTIFFNFRHNKQLAKELYKFLQVCNKKNNNKTKALN